MIVISLMGGLGNQLQQYALYEKYVSLGKEVALDISWYRKKNKSITAYRDIELNLYPKVSYRIATKREINSLKGNNILSKVRRKLLGDDRSLYIEHSSNKAMYDENIYSYDNMYLYGYFACDKYYSDIMNVLRDKLEFPKPNNILNIETSIAMQSEESVSVHIRRGDYLSEANQIMFGGICTEEYYNSAMNKIDKLYPNRIYYIFSDDPDYIRDRYQGDNIRVVDWNSGNDSYYDIYLMSNCKHNICANSTFSFWGARLNANINKTIIRPLKQKNDPMYEPKIMKELWSDWVLIDELGEVIN